MNNTLNDQQEKFCQEYLIDLNARQAYIRAGYSPTKSADSAASRLLKNVKVRARIDAMIAERSVRTGVSQDRVVRELARIAFVDPTRVIDFEHGNLVKNITDDDRAALAGMRIKDGDMFTEREIKLCDKVKALELLGKHLGIFTDKVQVESDAPRIVFDFPRPEPPQEDATDG